MKRQIYVVESKCIDPSGGWVNSLSAKSFDSRNYNNDIDLTLKRATGEFASVWSSMCGIDNRPLQVVMLMTADGFVIDKKVIGAIPDVEEETEAET